MSIRELAIEFEGFGDIRKKLHKDVQPEVINKKTGRPYDLTDPDFPVVTDHKFRYRYWAMTKDSASLIHYLEEHYDYFNRTRFHSKLKRPTIALLKNLNALKMKTRGVWKSSLRTLAISPNMFNAPHEGWVNRVLIHEMAHQYVTDFEDGEDEEKGHGPKWKACMVRAGLPPLRFDYETLDNYMDKVEKQKHATELEFRDRVSKAYQSLKSSREPVTKVDVGLEVLFVDQNGEILYGQVQGKRGTFWLVSAIGREGLYRVRKDAMFKPKE